MHRSSRNFVRRQNSPCPSGMPNLEYRQNRPKSVEVGPPTLTPGQKIGAVYLIHNKLNSVSGIPLDSIRREYFGGGEG